MSDVEKLLVEAARQRLITEPTCRPSGAQQAVETPRIELD